ncbi:sulfurtransferase, partial [Enterobacter hormaechei]
MEATMSTSYFVAADYMNYQEHEPQLNIKKKRMAPPGQEHRDVTAEYRAGHLPGAVF